MAISLLCHKNSINLGDEIQTIAAAQLLARLGVPISPIMVDRDSGEVTSSVPARPIPCIYNGWFDGMYCTLPSCDGPVKPLYISYHINEVPKVKAYDRLRPWQKSEPSSLAQVDLYTAGSLIGCRDAHTMSRLLRAGVPSARLFVSNCITLSLRAANGIKGASGILIVDCPDYESAYYYAKRANHSRLPITQLTHVWTGAPDDIAGKTARAHQLLDLYQCADLVITSRLHVILPCFAYGTRVVYAGSAAELEGDVRFAGMVRARPLGSGLGFTEIELACSGFVGEDIIAAWAKRVVANDAGTRCSFYHS